MSTGSTGCLLVLSQTSAFETNNNNKKIFAQLPLAHECTPNMDYCF